MVAMTVTMALSGGKLVVVEMYKWLGMGNHWLIS